MSKTLWLRNRQRTCPIDLRLLRRVLRHVVERQFLFQEYELCFHLIGADEMGRLHWQFLRQRGPTDVISFDHSRLSPAPNDVRANRPRIQPRFQRGNSPPLPPLPGLHGEVFLSVDEANVQARRFRTTWQSELVRYAIHGLLHLRGYDDLQRAARREMKRAEDLLLEGVASHFDLGSIRKRPPPRPSRDQPQPKA